MEKTHKLPDWYTSIDDVPAELLPAIEVVFESDGSYYFSGIIAAMIKRGLVPLRIDIALDFQGMSCMARLDYGDAFHFCLFEPESFAFLWNAEPEKVHGYPSDQIHLHFQDGDKDYPILASAGVMLELYFKNDRFRVFPSLERLDLLDDAA